MIIYIDRLSGDEIGSDSHGVSEHANGTIVSITGKMITIGDDDDNINIGANASAEEAVESLESNKKQVVNIVHSHQLQPFSVANKDEFKQFLKSYFKTLSKKLDESKDDSSSAAEFKAHQPDIGKWVSDVLLPNFKDFVFYVGPTADIGTPNFMIIPARWENDATAPTFYYYFDGLRQEKV